MMQAPSIPAPYPIQFHVDYAEKQSRWKALFRLVLVLPAFLFVALAIYGWYLSLLPTWIAILVRGRIPRWLFDFHVGFLRFYYRVIGYFALLTDTYPAFDGEYPIRFDASYPPRVSRRQVLIWKTATVLPQLIVVSVLWTAAMAIAAVGWLVILFTGQFPKGLHSFVAGVMRWQARVAAYWLSLTDKYPPYSMDADAPAASGTSLGVSIGIGVLAFSGLVGGGIAGFALFVTHGGQDFTREVSYQRLLSGDVSFKGAADIHSGLMQLRIANDPARESYGFLQPVSDARFVEFGLSVLNWRGANETVPIRTSAFSLTDTHGNEHDAKLVVSDGKVAPVDIDSGHAEQVILVFELPRGADPSELRWDVLDYISFPRVGETITWVFN